VDVGWLCRLIFYAAIFRYTGPAAPAWPAEASQSITARDDDVILSRMHQVCRHDNATNVRTHVNIRAEVRRWNK